MRKSIRKLAACLCLWALLGSGLTVPARAAGFTDVPSGHWAAEAVSQCVSRGWFQGKSADTFGVGQPMTRGAFAVVLSRFFDWQPQGADYEIFSDVPRDAWYEPAVRACYEHGAVTRQTGTFRPADAITREELAVLLIRALGCGSTAGLFSETALPFRDVTTNRGYIAMAYEMGLVNGMGGDLFVPHRAATREQTAVILSRLYGRLHPIAQENAAIVHPGEAPADYTGCQTAVVMGGMLTGGRNPRFAASDSEAWQKTASGAREAGCQVLLGVSGQASALEAGTSAAEPLLQALEDSGADGLYLDITQRQWTDAVHLTQLAEALHRAAPEKKLYVEADAPVRGELDPDYAGLAAAADRIVLRVPAVTDSAAAVPVCAMEPLENICYALSVLNDEVPAQKLSLLLTAAGQAWNAGSRRFSTVTGDTLEAMLEEGTTYYSDRYACAYAETENGVVWYLDGRGLAARRQLLNCFGVNALCVSTPEGMLTLAES